MDTLKKIGLAIWAFFKRTFTLELLGSLFAPIEEYGRAFYYGFAFFVIANVFVSNAYSFLAVVLIIGIMQTYDYVTNKNPYNLADYLFAIAPGFVMLMIR